MQKLGRNEKCYCGSDKKYKKCCMNKNDNFNKKPIHIQILNAMEEANIEECLYLDKTNCTEKIIKAHSLQNNKILNKLSENDKVLMRSPKMSENNFEIKMEPITRSSATTFTGFCSFHDNKVFEPIENSKYNPNSLEQNALFAFRALAKEWHAKLRAQKLCKQFLSKNPNNELMNCNLIGIELALEDIQKHIDIFKQILLEKKYNLLKTQYIYFEPESLFAVSCGVSIPYDFEGKKLDHISYNLDLPSKFLFVTIFPEENKTHVLLSYLKKDEDFYSFLKPQLLDVDQNTQKQRITNLVALNSENLVLAPSCWDKFDNNQKNTFLKIFNENLTSEEKPETLGTNYGFTLFN